MYFMRNSAHSYTLATTGLKKDVSRIFSSREEANKFMYKLCGKFGLHVEEVYDDHHDKTYKCNCGVRFYINRM